MKRPRLTPMPDSADVHGGAYFTTRRARARVRPLSAKHSMHLVLRAKCAKGELSFRRRRNREQVHRALFRFAHKNKIRVISHAVQSNHLHLHLRLKDCALYHPFIRALTAAIAMAVSKRSRWNVQNKKFWDQRPFTRLVKGAHEYRVMEDYIRINEFESLGCSRERARMYVNFGRAEDEDRAKRWLYLLDPG